MEAIFETERLTVRKLILDDLESLHEMQSNPKVMQYATGDCKSFEEHKEELNRLIAYYTKPNNDFWIYAIERKEGATFVGTVALVKDGEDDEIGYRFLQKFWGNGYGKEVCKGSIEYARQIRISKLIAYAVDKNIASAKILEDLGFREIKKFISDDIQLPETKYELVL